MPKKSKREKMLAETHRKLQGNTFIVSDHASLRPRPMVNHAFRFQMPRQKQPSYSVATGDATELAAIQKDLIKTLVLAIGAILAELVIYWFNKGQSSL